VVQIHPPQPNFPTTYARSTWSALSSSTKTSTNRRRRGPERLPNPPSLCNILRSLEVGLKTYPLVRTEAILRRDSPVEDCQVCAMPESAPSIRSPLFTEKEAASYLTRSVSSLRRDRKNGTGPGFIRIGRSIRYLRSQLDSYISSCVPAPNAEVDRG
jgi:hypothetical protein